MTRDEIFAAWSPPGAIWSNWTKPALFARLPCEVSATDGGANLDVSWAPPLAERVALIVDLPGAISVRCGLALASLGYRPVPLFNAVPPPAGSAAASVVDVEPILNALQQGAQRLQELSIPTEAPPAFLMDANRQANEQPLLPGTFDNRSVVFVSDFPSAARLTGQGIARALLVREHAAGLEADLTYALQIWKRGGIDLSAKWLENSDLPTAFNLPRPSFWSGLRLRLADLFGLRRNAAGEFGEFIPRAAGG